MARDADRVRRLRSEAARAARGRLAAARGGRRESLPDARMARRLPRARRRPPCGRGGARRRRRAAGGAAPRARTARARCAGCASPGTTSATPTPCWSRRATPRPPPRWRDWPAAACAASGVGWDAIALRYVDAEASWLAGFLDGLGGAVALRPRRGGAPLGSTCRAGDWAQYLGTLKRTDRKETRRLERRALEAGASYRTLEEPEEVEDGMACLFAPPRPALGRAGRVEPRRRGAARGTVGLRGGGCRARVAAAVAAGGRR